MLRLLLLINGVVEGTGGILAFLFPEKVTEGNGNDRRLARTFGVALLSIGVTAFLASRSNIITQSVVAKGMIFYHTLVVGTLLHSYFNERKSTRQALPGLILLHSCLAIAFVKSISSLKEVITIKLN